MLSNFLSKAVPFMRYVKKKMIEPARPHMTIRHLHRARWITMATDTHTEYVILTSLLLQ